MIDLGKILSKLSGMPTKKEIKKGLKEIKRKLLEADVDEETALAFVERVKKALEGGEGSTRYRLYQAVYEEMRKMVGNAKNIDEARRIALTGLYGSGKTTTVAKLARYFQKRGRSVGVITYDRERPAAVQQLEKLISGVAKFGQSSEVTIYDLPGRAEPDGYIIKKIKEVQPDEVLLVLPADMGHKAKEIAEKFSDLVSAIVITRMDGSGKAGGVLNAIAQTGLPVAFVGTGERIDDLEVFDPDQYTKKLLSIPVLPQQFKEELKEINVHKLTLNDLLKEIEEMRKMGSIKKMLSMFGLSSVPREMLEKSEEMMNKYHSIILSMTPAEREDPLLVERSRSRQERIARGSGRRVEDVRKLLKEWKRTITTVKRLKSDRRFKHLLAKR